MSQPQNASQELLQQISHSANGIKRGLQQHGFAVSAGHVRELLAAALGHKSFAALQAGWSTDFELGDFLQAAFVLDQQTFDHRALSMGYQPSAQLNDVFLGALLGDWNQRFNTNFTIDWEISQVLEDSEEVKAYPLDDHFSGEIASSNAIMDEWEMDTSIATLPAGHLPETLTVNIGFDASMEADEDRAFTTFMEEYLDNGFSGEVELIYATTASRGLIFLGYNYG